MLRLTCCITFLITAFAGALSAKSPEARRAFTDYYELEPFQITGEDIPITVFARSESDRRYATKFAHNVVEVAYETLEKSPGGGLVIIGRDGEPHPITILERFKEIASSEQASPAQKALAEELEKALEEWRSKIHFDTGNNKEEDMPIDMDTLVNALPIPLPKLAADIYLLAWKENFEKERVDLRLANLTAADLDQQEFEEFQWVFYLPPKNALNQVLKEVLPAVFKAEKIGPFKRVLIRGAIATFKPVIKDAMEGVRKGIFYWSVLSANESAFHPGDIEELTKAYFQSQMPRGKILGSDKKESALEAIKKQKAENAAYALDPFVIPEPLARYDPATYAKLQGEYGAKDHRNKHFRLENGIITWQEGDDDPIEYLPAGENLFVSSQKDITLKFLRDDLGQFNSVLLRKGRQSWTFQRFPDVALN